MDIKLNLKLDTGEAKKQFGKTGRVQVQNFFTEKCADEFQKVLINGLPWDVAYRENGEDKAITNDQLISMTDRRGREVRDRIIDRAIDGDFQYSYYFHPLTKTKVSQMPEGHFSHDLVDFIASDGFPDTIRAMTGLKSLHLLSAEATIYEAHNFMMPRSFDDDRIGFIISLTKNWRPDFGGYIQFFDERDNVVEAHGPHFNNISLFRGNLKHAIGYVTPYVPALRLVISGWLGKK